MITQTARPRPVRRPARIGTAVAALAAAGTVLAGCSIPVSATESGTDRIGEAVTAVQVNAGAGTVRFRPGPPGSAQIDRVLRWTGDAKPQVTHQMRDGVLTITATCPDDSDDCNTDLTVTAPSAAGVRTTLGAGEISVTGLTGAQDLSTGAGNVEGDRLGAASVTARTNAGNVDLAFAAAPPLVDAQSTAGNVTVRVPSGAAYDVEATSTVGNGDVGVPDTPGAPHRVIARSTAGNAEVLPG